MNEGVLICHGMRRRRRRREGTANVLLCKCIVQRCSICLDSDGARSIEYHRLLFIGVSRTRFEHQSKPRIIRITKALFDSTRNGETRRRDIAGACISISARWADEEDVRRDEKICEHVWHLHRWSDTKRLLVDGSVWCDEGIEV